MLDCESGEPSRTIFSTLSYNECCDSKLATSNHQVTKTPSFHVLLWLTFMERLRLNHVMVWKDCNILWTCFVFVFFEIAFYGHVVSWSRRIWCWIRYFPPPACSEFRLDTVNCSRVGSFFFKKKQDNSRNLAATKSQKGGVLVLMKIKEKRKRKIWLFASGKINYLSPKNCHFANAPASKNWEVYYCIFRWSSSAQGSDGSSYMHGLILVQEGVFFYRMYILARISRRRL